MLLTEHYADFEPNMAERQETAVIIFSDMFLKCKPILEGQ